MATIMGRLINASLVSVCSMIFMRCLAFGDDALDGVEGGYSVEPAGDCATA